MTTEDAVRTCDKPSTAIPVPDHLTFRLRIKDGLGTLVKKQSPIVQTITIINIYNILGLLVLHLIHKSYELKEKNDVIVREVRRNQELIDRAVQNGVRRAAML